MAIKRLDFIHGGFKDGMSYQIDPALYQDNQADFIAQPEVAKLRTARAITRDASGHAQVATDVSHKITGLISFGFIDRLETRESANAGSNPAGEGLTVATGSFGTTLDIGTMFDGGTIGSAKAGAKLYCATDDVYGKLTTVKPIETSSVEEQAQIDTVDTITAVNDTTYSVTINGEEISYTSDASATVAEITLGLTNAINASAQNVTAADGGTAVTITADNAGVAFSTLVTAGTMTVTTTTPNIESVDNTAQVLGWISRVNASTVDVEIRL